MLIRLNSISFIVAICVSLLWPSFVVAWPTQHPGNAVYKRIEYYDDEKFDSYFWWEGNNLYMEAVPVVGQPFLSGIDFIYIQNGKQGEIEFYDENGDVFLSNYLFVKTILKIKAFNGVIDSSSDTTLINTYNDPIYIQIPKSDGPDPTSVLPEVTTSSVVVNKIVCKAGGKKVKATQKSDNRFSCDGLEFKEGRKVTITITGKMTD